uniref:phycytochrome bilisome core-membrane linker protein n=1 Tax=Tsunamia transpacifica TaxID=1935457 RepID=UPI001BF0725B|nr:phycytochrome bilisome core-membrane linker protein [Tsunamia transpacifica]QUE27905.1 ApcE [Tsunamia transpacifica]UNJ14421.1 phycytochrome bilisome core-membrane linker protein [Tsunamia transpacifica]
MTVKASGGSPVVQPQLYRTASTLAILQAEQQDRYLQLGELDQLSNFLNSGNKRLDIAVTLAKNATFLVAKAANKIFIGGSPLSYLERPQAAVQLIGGPQADLNQQAIGDLPPNFSKNLNSSFTPGESIPSGFKPINVVSYGPERTRKSLRDLDWFLRYLTYAIVAGDPNILSVNIRGLKQLIENACSSTAAVVALREIRRFSIALVADDLESRDLVRDYCNVLISEFEASALTDQLRKRESTDLQGLRLPRIYSNAGVKTQRFVMKPGLSENEKSAVIKATYRQVFERDIAKAYNLSISQLESQVKNGQLSVKEFIRALGKSRIYQKQFYDSFVNSRALELAFRHFLGRGPSSLEEFQKYFAIISQNGLAGLVDALINSDEYADYFGEETVPYLRSIGEEPQECRNWGAQFNLFNYSAPFYKTPQFITLFSDYNQALPDQHPYGRGNDPLDIQFGAIFSQSTRDLKNRPAPFGKDTRRILIRRGPGILNQLSMPRTKSKTAGSLGPRIFKLESESTKEALDFRIENIGASREIIVRATYLRIFGRQVYEEERLLLKPIENSFLNGQITVQEFVRRLAKSDIFRSLYWTPYYVCKAIEYIHIRLLGRPTYGRTEINKYFNIEYKEGYYSVIDAIVDSNEYLETFGENIVPYDRYSTSSGIAARMLRKSTISQNFPEKQSISTSKFVELGMTKETRSISGASLRVQQGVSKQREQRLIFSATSDMSKAELGIILKAAYRQIFERDVNSFSIGNELTEIEREFLSGSISVRELISRLGYSGLYRKEFYAPFPNTKVIELGTKHFLGRAPNSQAEIRYYNLILANQGISEFIKSLIESQEYNLLYGENIIPYRRFPTLPAANFPNTEKLYNQLTKQNIDIVVPSFQPVNKNYSIQG